MLLWPDYDAIYKATHAGGNSVVFNAFLKSQSFCEAFYARYTELKETSLSYTRTLKQMARPLWPSR